MSRAPLTALTVFTMLLLCASQGQAKVRKSSATPVVATLLGGSTASLDLGGGAVRTAPLSGVLRGVIPGGYRLSQDNTLALRSGHVAIGAVALLSDGCATAPAVTSALTTVGLAPATPATSLAPAMPNAVLHKTGVVSATVPVVLRTVLDVRSGPCGSATVPTGFADTPLTLDAFGRIRRGFGLNQLTLDSAPQPLTIQACLAPGAPTAACSTTPVAYPVSLSTHLVVNVKIG
jgi:hypothetical protein